MLGAVDGRCGVDLYRIKRPDVVLTELLMPEQDGIETLLAIRRQDPAAKVIVISGHNGFDFLRLAKQLGANAVLRKPLDIADLSAAIYRCLGRSAVADRSS